MVVISDLIHSILISKLLLHADQIVDVLLFSKVIAASRTKRLASIAGFVFVDHVRQFECSLRNVEQLTVRQPQQCAANYDAMGQRDWRMQSAAEERVS